MSSNVTLNGVQYVVPAYNDTGWAQGAGNLSLYLAAIASNTLQPTGGAFTLTADVDFGANFGLKVLFLKSETANPASAGVVRLASADTIKWRNNANGADIALSKDASDNLQYNATKVLLSGAVVNADINAAAAIAYSKLALTNSIVNADINASAAIAYSKLALTGAILNADLAGSIAYSKLVLTGSVVNGDLTAGTILNTAINASAAIALSKLAALGTAKALQSNASTGFIEASAVTNTELGYVSGVTSAIQTQINAIVQKYFQTVQATYATITTNTNGTLTDSGLTASITPASSSHKVKITVSVVWEASASSETNATMVLQLVRGTSTVILGPHTVGNGFSSAVTHNAFGVWTVSYVDSPATSSAQSYKVQFARSPAGTGNATVQPSSATSVMVLEEIA